MLPLLPPSCRSKLARKLLAVPYRAAHKPSERSEYSQPDTALTLTDLAYYDEGLSLVRCSRPGGAGAWQSSMAASVAACAG